MTRCKQTSTRCLYFDLTLVEFHPQQCQLGAAAELLTFYVTGLSDPRTSTYHECEFEVFEQNTVQYPEVEFSDNANPPLWKSYKAVYAPPKGVYSANGIQYYYSFLLRSVQQISTQGNPSGIIISSIPAAIGCTFRHRPDSRRTWHEHKASIILMLT